MLLTYYQEKKLFIFKCNYVDKDIPKNAEFIWESKSKLWYTNSYFKAIKLKKYATPDTLKVLENMEKVLQNKLNESLASQSDYEPPKPDNGMEYYPYQKAGVFYAKDRPVTFMFDDMGLGKGPMSIGVINTILNAKRVLIICPNSMKHKWKREWEKWTIHKHLSIGISSGVELNLTDVMIMNYEIFSRNIANNSGKYNATANALKHLRSKKLPKFDCIIIDEAHRLKNWNANTTKNIFKLKPFTNKLLLLTGSPVLNKPDDIWMMLRFADIHKTFATDKTDFLMKYCGYSYDKYGRLVIDYSKIDPEKLKELQIRLRTKLMIRRTKTQVLTELPLKTRSIVPITVDSKYFEEFRSLEHLSSNLVEINETLTTPSIVTGLKPSQIEELTRLRFISGIAKVPETIDYVKDILTTGEKVLLFCHHHDVMDRYIKAFPSCVAISGRTSLEDREKNIHKFQTNNLCNVAVLQMDSAGVGLDLTAGNHVVFAEFHWVPKIMEQCEDRALRIGQTKPVTVHIMVANGTIDAVMGELVVNKIKMAKPMTDL